MGIDQSRMDLLTEIFHQLKMEYDMQNSDTGIEIQFPVALNPKKKISQISIQMDVQETYILYHSIAKKDLVIKTDPEIINRIIEFISRANQGLLNGNFEYNYNQKIITYKIYQSIEFQEKDNKINAAQIAQNIVVIGNMWERYGDQIVEAIETNRDIQELIKEAEIDKEAIINV